MAETKIDEIEKIEAVSADTVFQQDRALIDIQISTAKSYPRNIKRAVDNIIALVTMDEETAQSCIYSVPRGDKNISGPSVHLAKIIAQNWGNMRAEMKVVAIDAKQITSQGVAWDLETNLAIKGEVKRSIIGKRGRFNDDMITVTGNAANAIALRNAIFAVIPKSVVDKALKEAKGFLIGDVSDNAKLVSRRKQVVDALKDTYSVTEKEILDSIKCSSILHITADDLLTLIGFGTAIKDGDATVENTFRGGKSVAPDEILISDLKELFEMKKDALSPAELADCNRVINNEEKKSYKKIHILLSGK